MLGRVRDGDGRMHFLDALERQRKGASNGVGTQRKWLVEGDLPTRGREVESHSEVPETLPFQAERRPVHDLTRRIAGAYLSARMAVAITIPEGDENLGAGGYSMRARRVHRAAGVHHADGDALTRIRGGEPCRGVYGDGEVKSILVRIVLTEAGLHPGYHGTGLDERVAQPGTNDEVSVGLLSKDGGVGRVVVAIFAQVVDAAAPPESLVGLEEYISVVEGRVQKG